MANTSDIKAGNAYVSVHADTSAVAGEIDKGVLHELKHGLGGRSEFKEVFELLKGGGAVVGIGVAAEAIKGLAEGGIKFKEAMAAGDKNLADMAQLMLKSVPVLNSIEGAGATINELFTGQQEEAKKVNEEAERLNKALERRVGILKSGREAADEMGKTLREITGKGELVGKTGLGADAIRSRQELLGTMAGIGSSRRSGLKSINEAGEVEVTDATGAKRKVPVMDPTLRKQLQTKADQLQGEIDEAKRKSTEAVSRIGLGSVYAIAQNAQNVAGVGGSQKELAEIKSKLLDAKLVDEALKSQAGNLNTLSDSSAKQAIGNYIAEGIDQLLDAGLEAYGSESRREGEADRKLRARRIGQDGVANDIANQRQAIIDGLKKPGEKFADEKQYIESLGFTGATLEKALQQARDQIFGKTGVGQFGGAGAENVFGGGGVQERIAKATEDTAKEVKKIVSSTPRFR